VYIDNVYFYTDNNALSSLTSADQGSEHSEKTVVSPNPVQDRLTLQGIQGVYKLEVYNTMGIQVLDIPVDQDSNTHTVDMSSLSEGLYFVKTYAYKKTELYKVLKRS